MATKLKKQKTSRIRRKMHIRKKVNGTAERPRLVIVRSLNHVYASLVDDELGKTLTGVTDINLKPAEAKKEEKPAEEGEEKKGKKKSKGPKMGRKMQAAFNVGLAIAAVAKDRGISQVVFDRNGLRYHGRVKALADGARKGGLEF